MKLTEEFLRDCHRAVLRGINQGLVICPPLEKPQETKNTYRRQRKCEACGVDVEMHSRWQKRCLECSIAKDREVNRRKRS